MREIGVARKRSNDAGGCNACTDNVSGPGRDYPVWEISLRGCSVRLCFKCRRELLYKLNEFPITEES